MESREFPPVLEPKKNILRRFVDEVTSQEAKRQQQDLVNIGKYTGIVRKVDEETLQLSTSDGGARQEQNLIAGACRLAIETGMTVSLRSPAGQLDTVNPEIAKGVLTGIAMSFPHEMSGERLIKGQPSDETLKYCAECVVATMRNDDVDARFYDSLMSGKDIRKRFTELQTELNKREKQG